MITGLSGDNSSLRKRSGYSLVEVMIALSLALMILAGIMASLIFIIGSSISVGNYIDMNKEGRLALEVMGRDIRNAAEIDDGYSTTEFRIHVLHPNETQTTVTYSYDPNAANRPLVRTTSDGSRVLVGEVDELSFRYYDLQGGEVHDYALPVRQIQIQLTTLRERGGIDNTDRIISARFILRNKHVTN